MVAESSTRKIVFIVDPVFTYLYEMHGYT
jgi:hypothetical protein